MDVGDAVAFGVGAARPRREGEIGAETVRRGKPRPLADQHQQHARVDERADLVTQRDPCARCNHRAADLDRLGSELRNVNIDERDFDRLQAIILSMTAQERRHPELIKGSRRLRIAQGSGTNVHAVKQLIKQFEQMRKVMRQVSQGRMPELGALMRQGR